jgi:hypothetical protein
LIDVTLTQHPVGQGGMMSGYLAIDGGHFHWVYDCGSNQNVALKREIAQVAARGPIDCLFLSHLDSDHLNGIDLLLAQTSVAEVVLPYLNDLDRLVAAAHDASTGALRGEFLSFLGDMAGWLGARGVERVSFIDPRSDDDGEGVPLPDFGPGGGGRDVGEGPIRGKWQGGGQSADKSVLHHESGEGPAVQYLSTDAHLILVAGSSVINWILAPYAHRPSDRRMLAFRRAMVNKFGRNYLSQLPKMIKDDKVREQIKECYDLIWSDHNLVSMANYAGPSAFLNWKSICSSGPFNARHPHIYNAVGWLGTGDMHLDVGIRRKAMLGHYRQLLDQVNVFALPHHGSRRNFHPSLLASMPNMTQALAAAGPNGYGHPHTDVIESVQSASRYFVQVSDTGRTVLQWRFSA